jgi:hypothetical protein
MNFGVIRALRFLIRHEAGLKFLFEDDLPRFMAEIAEVHASTLFRVGQSKLFGSWALAASDADMQKRRARMEPGAGWRTEVSCK